MTDTHEQTSSDNALIVLEKIKQKGYIRPAEASQYYQKVNHIVTNFLAATPINPQDTAQCMQLLTDIGRNTDTFFSLSSFQNIIFDLYEQTTVANDDFIRNRATTKLLSFFSNVSPNSIEQKNKLLNIIQGLPDIKKRGSEISRVVFQIANHYDKNQQFNEDPDLSVLKNMSNILHQISVPIPGRTRSNGNVSEAQERFQSCAAFVKTYAPELYDTSWEGKFHPRHKNYSPTFLIKEPVDIFSTRGRMQKSVFLD